MAQTPTGRRAVSLADGAAHDHDHDTWTRRDFLLRAGFGGAATLALAGLPVQAMCGGPLLQRVAALETDRVLVLLQLKGGNDGLNTVVPVRNDLYYRARPTLAIAPAEAIALADGFGLHPALAPAERLWGSGQMAVVHAAGYDDSSLSHFESLDVWATARHEGPGALTGWGATTIDRLGAGPDPVPLDERDDEDGATSAETAADALARTVSPPAIQIGTHHPLLFSDRGEDLSLTVASTAALERLVAGAGLYDPSDTPPLPYGAELAYARQVANASTRYVGAVREAAARTRAVDGYPASTLGQHLAGVARMIRGRLGTRIYLVTLGGFDTHRGQAERHAELMADLGAAVQAFYADLTASGDAERTLTMTFSEFGRRVAENGSRGTDHGTAAPLFAFGPGVTGGLYGTPADLGRLDAAGNMTPTTDFRQAYAAVLGSWLGLPATDTTSVLGGAYTPVPFVGV